jgi:hypothetical protein
VLQAYPFVGSLLSYRSGGGLCVGLRGQGRSNMRECVCGSTQRYRANQVLSVLVMRSLLLGAFLLAIVADWNAIVLR